MKKRQLSKKEIISQIKKIQKFKKASSFIPFSTMAIFCNHILWKDEHWEQDALAEYNQIVANYYRELENENNSVEKMLERIYAKAGFPIETILLTEDNIKSPCKQSFQYKMEKKVIEADNTIKEMSKQYFAAHYNALLDMGYTKQQMEKNKDTVNMWFSKFSTLGGPKISNWHTELAEEAGIIIEIPKI